MLCTKCGNEVNVGTDGSGMPGIEPCARCIETERDDACKGLNNCDNCSMCDDCDQKCTHNCDTCSQCSDEYERGKEDGYAEGQRSRDAEIEEAYQRGKESARDELV